MSLPTTFTEDQMVINTVIETPKDSIAKYNYDKATGMFVLKKLLPRGMVFPFHFGFIPHTKGGDKDPLDILVLLNAPAWPGCIVESKLLGILEADEEKNGERVRNDRIIAAATASDQYSGWNSLNDLGSLLTEIENFFLSYTSFENKGFRILDRKGAEAALSVVKKSMI